MAVVFQDMIHCVLVNRRQPASKLINKNSLWLSFSPVLPVFGLITQYPSTKTCSGTTRCNPLNIKNILEERLLPSRTKDNFHCLVLSEIRQLYS